MPFVEVCDSWRVTCAVESERARPKKQPCLIAAPATRQVMKIAKGGYSVVMLITGAGILAFRDVYGIRPLVIGRRTEGPNADYIAASGALLIAHASG